MASTYVTRCINAPPAKVYAALLDAAALPKWKVPDGMTCYVQEFEPREGGAIRVSLTYEAATAAGKTTARTDTYHGRFLKLVPNERVVEVDEFETEDPALRGEMTITITLANAEGGGTEVVGIHEGLPPGVSVADNEACWRMALDKLGVLVEGRSRMPRDMAAARKATPINDYLRTVPEDRRRALEDLRAKIRSVVPDAEECISYGMPAFRLHGAVVAGFQATKNGGSYYPFSGSTLAAVARFVRAYEHTKSALHFSPHKPLPITLVRRLIKARLAEIEESQVKRSPSARRRKG
jgi:uncharacterized protein YdhG (YjbR/CyaY superfamily)/uncharacterized protein YndB with AHSA1/START domain